MGFRMDTEQQWGKSGIPPSSSPHQQGPNLQGKFI
jgi:hypothetical protein